MSTFRALLCAGVFVLAAAPMIAHAADKADTDLKVQAEAIMEQVAERYRSLDSYADEVELSYEVEMTEGAAGMMGPAMFPTQTFELALAAPNKVAFENEQIAFYCDGESMWVSMPMFGQYIKREAPDTWNEVFLAPDAEMFASTIGHPVVQTILREEEAIAQFIGEWREVNAIETVEHDGVRATHIKATCDIPQLAMMSDEPIPCEVWINEETGLIMELRADYTAVYNAMMEQMGPMYGMEEEDDEEEGDEDATPPYEKFLLIASIQDIKLNEDLAASRFAFSGDDGEEVENFSFPGMGPDQQIRLVGEEAPEFTLATLDGEELALSSLRGNVVLLDFWATWCGPCVQALPKVQEIHEHFEGKPVVVLGVNRDQPGMESHVTDFLEKKDITFGHVMDVDGSAAEAYHVRGIPSSILIDANGIVQDVGTGFMPGKEKELIKKIDKLLAGERIYDPEDIAAQVAELGEFDEDAYSGGYFGMNTKESRELRDSIVEQLGTTTLALNELELPSGIGMQSWQLKLVDMNGDGKPAMVTPEGRMLRIVSFDGSESDRVTLRGLPGNGHVQFFDAIGHGDDLRWLVSSVRMSMGMGTTSSVNVSMHQRSGENIWTYSPEIPAGVQANTSELTLADLNDDGRDEVIVPLQAMRMDYSNREMMMPSAQASHVIVLDQDGKLLAHQAVGNMVYGIKVTDAPDGTGKAILCLTDGKPAWLQLGEPAKVDTGESSANPN